MRKSFIILALLCMSISSVVAAGMPNSYYEITSDTKQKEVFFDYLYTLIEKENLHILEERKIVENVLGNNILEINYMSKDFNKLLKLQNKYKVQSFFSKEEYLKKIDIVPPALALAQAAVESGWGKSRFVKEANNIFGHWTYGEKGLIPQSRDEGAKHKIRIFSSLQSSIRAYMLNLNRNSAYKSFREKRVNMRLQEQTLVGIELSQTMINYSGIGKKYLVILESMISQQNLSKFDNKFFEKINQNI